MSCMHLISFTSTLTCCRCCCLCWWCQWWRWWLWLWFWLWLQLRLRLRLRLQLVLVLVLVLLLLLLLLWWWWWWSLSLSLSLSMSMFDLRWCQIQDKQYSTVHNFVFAARNWGQVNDARFCRPELWHLSLVESMWTEQPTTQLASRQ